MKRIMLLLAFYVLASIGVQAQVVNPDGVKEIWVNDSISSEIYFSPDSSAFFHAYFAKNCPEDELQTILLFKRDLMTNKVLQKKRIYYPYDGGTGTSEGRPPEMAVSLDGSFLVLFKINTHGVGGGKKYNTDSIFVFDQQTLELLRAIPVTLEEVIAPYYDAEKYKYVFFENFEDPIFIDNERLIFGGRYTDRYIVPNDYPNHVEGGVECIYNVKTGEFIEETAYTRAMKDINMLRFGVSKKTSDGKYLFGIGNINNSTHIMTIETNNLDNYRIHNIDPNIMHKYYNFNQDGTKIYYTEYENPNLYFIVFDLLLDKEELKIDITYFKGAGGRPVIFKNNKYITLRKNVAGGSETVLYNIETYESYFINNDNNINCDYLLEGNDLFLFSGYRPESDYNHQPKTAKLFHFDLDSILAIKDKEISENLIYPNPSFETINVPINEYTHRIEIFDVSGSIVYSTPSLQDNDISQNGNYLIDISKLQAGAYFVKVLRNGIVVEYKFVKM